MSSTEVSKAVSRIAECQSRINKLNATMGQIHANAESATLIVGHQEEIKSLRDEITELKTAHSIGYAVWASRWNGNTYLPSEVVSNLYTERNEADGECAQNWMPKNVDKKVKYVVVTTSHDPSTKQYTGHY